ncbi:7TM chemoreceptor [Cooperia oncophora]
MNLFAFYCIVYKSTRQMGAYKWYLLAYQASSTAFDTVYTGFIIPVIYFPEAMGYPGSWLAVTLSITGHAGVIMVFLTAALLVGCILNLFNYRCHVVTPNHYFFKIGNNGHIYTSSAISLTYFISLAAGLIDILPDQEERKIWAVKEYPCLQSVIYGQSTFYGLHTK